MLLLTALNPGVTAYVSVQRRLLCQQAQPITGGPEAFYLAAVSPPEDKDVARQRIIFQGNLHLGSQTIEAIYHVGDAGHQPYFCARRQREHRLSSCISIGSRFSADGTIQAEYAVPERYLAG